jgi:dolichyl-phosphate-mannose--protein O-mannosyl transferase
MKEVASQSLRKAISINRAFARRHSEAGFFIETTFVLFFFGVEFGRILMDISFNIDSFVYILTLLALAFLPYFASDRKSFLDWAFGRVLIAVFAILIGMMLRKTTGTILPDSFRFLPMTFLILVAVATCYIQFYSFLKLRLKR